MKRLTYLWLACTLLVNTVAEAQVRTVALTGQPAPGTPSGVNYGGFGSPVLNDAGQTAFFAGLSGNGADSTNLSGFWSEGSGHLALVARAGSQAPGAPSGVNFINLFYTSSTPLLNNAGQTAFVAVLTDNSNGIWSEGSGSLASVARSGSQAPGTPSGVNYSGVSGVPVLNDAGQTAFYANLTGGGVVPSVNDRGIWLESSGSPARVALTGSQAPGTSSGVNFGVSFFGPPVLNDAGQTAFRAQLTGSGVDSTNSSGIWSNRSGDLALVVHSGDHAPGTPSGVNFGGISAAAPSLNNAGQTAFRAGLAGSGVDATNDQAIWSEGSGSLALVARTGSQAPGTPSGVNYSSFQPPVLNDAGRTAFRAFLTGSGVDSTNNDGIWSEGSGGLALIARNGDHAPGTPSGVNFGGPNAFTGPELNDAGQTAFGAGLIGNGAESISYGIWATDLTDTLQLIARIGELLEVAPGDFRTISSLGFVGNSTGNSDGRPSAFNNLGQLAFSAGFTGGSSGIFVSNVVAVPEPSALLLAAVGLLSLVMFRWRSAT